MDKINWGRVLLGGIAAGVIIILIGMFVIGPMMMPLWEEGMKSGMWKEVTAAGMLCYNVKLLVVGILATFLYAAIRPRFGGGVSTAILAGILVAVFKDVFPGIGRLIWSTEPTDTVTMFIVLASIQSIVGTFVGAWIYQET